MDARVTSMMQNQTSADHLMTLIFLLETCAVRVTAVRKEPVPQQPFSAEQDRRDKLTLTRLLIDVQPPPRETNNEEA